MTNQKPPRRSPTKPAVQESETVNLSLVQQIADLAVGKSVSITERLDGDEATKDTIRETRERLRNTVAAAVKRAKDKTGATYTVEGGEITTRSLDLLVVVAITRME